MKGVARKVKPSVHSVESEEESLDIWDFDFRWAMLSKAVQTKRKTEKTRRRVKNDFIENEGWMVVLDRHWLIKK